jgi:hypothetical protein
MEMRKGVIFEGVAGTGDRDIQNEILDIAGADITDLKEGRGFLDSEHALNRRNVPMAQGGSFAHLVGRVVDANKIMNVRDCRTEKQMQAWDRRRKPFIWVTGELWDGHGHAEADSIASIYKFYQAKGEEPPIKLSVEGRTLEKDKQTGVLKRTQIRGIAMTVHPANRATHTEVVSMLKNAGFSSDLVKSEDYIAPMFVERTQGSIEKVLELSKSARDLIRLARAGGLEVPRFPLRSAALLNAYKGLKARA